MLEDTFVEIFKVDDVRKASHMVTDVPFWTRQFGLLADANCQHVLGIEKVTQHQEKYLDILKERKCRGRDEKLFYRQVKSLNGILTEQLEKLRTDASQYRDIEASLKGFEDKMDSNVCKLDQKYKLAMDKLNDHTKRVEHQKRLYHKLAFSAEKTEIKARMSDRAEILYEGNKKIEEMKTKVDAQLDKYSNHLDKWDLKLQNIQKIASEFEEAFNSREDARAKVVLDSLQNSVEFTMAGNYAKREVAFTQINEQRLINNAIIERETIKTPKIQFYTGESNKDAVQTAREETQRNDGVNARTHRPETSNDDALPGTSNTNQKDKTNVFVVIKPYERQEINQLSLKPGEHVTQLLPANNAGLAYGQVVHGILHKKKKGFYPVSHVVQLQIEARTSSRASVSPASTNLAENETSDAPRHERSAKVRPYEDNDERKISDARKRRREGKKKTMAKNIEPL